MFGGRGYRTTSVTAIVQNQLSKLNKISHVVRSRNVLDTAVLPRLRLGAVRKSTGSNAVGRAILAPRWGGGGGGGVGVFTGGKFAANRRGVFQQLFKGVRGYTTTVPAAPTLFSKANAFMIRTPLFTGVAFATVKTGLADVLMQLTTGVGDDYDWRRTGLFVVFGFGYMGLANYAFYYKGFTRLFPYLTEMSRQPFSIKLRDNRFLRQLFAANVVDNLVINPIIYWPIFYSFKEICFSDATDTRTITEMLTHVAGSYQNTWLNDNLSMAYFWVPANFLIYAVPIHLRLPLNHVISAAWSFILSYAWGAKVDEKEATGIALSGDVGASARDVDKRLVDA